MTPPGFEEKVDLILDEWWYKGGNLKQAITEALRASFVEGAKAMQERAATKAEVEWCMGRNSIVRAEELLSGLCQRAANSIRALDPSALVPPSHGDTSAEGKSDNQVKEG